MTEWEKKEFNKRIDEALYDAVCLLDWLTKRYKDDRARKFIYGTHCETLYGAYLQGYDWADIYERKEKGEKHDQYSGFNGAIGERSRA